MLYQRILPILFFLLFFTCAFAEDFLVTNNADAGPGTLREALTRAAANGNTEKDLIRFNLPGTSEADRTIVIKTDLPNISSNLIIDGTTQPGAKLGVSNAKVIISAGFTNIGTHHMLFINRQKDIEIYGLIIDNPKYKAVPSQGIFIVGSKNITIGAAGKGNVTKTPTGLFIVAQSDLIRSENVKISGNIFGINEDGETVVTAGYSQLSLMGVANLVLGGNSAAEGNLMSGQMIIGENYSDGQATGQLLIANNLLGVNYTGLKQLDNDANVLSVTTKNNSSVTIKNNVIVNASAMLDLNCFFRVTGNKFGTDITGTKIYGSTSWQLRLGYCAGGGIVGGPTIADQNIFSGAYRDAARPDQFGGVLLNNGSPKVEVVGNNFRCNYSGYSYALNPGNPPLFVTTITGRTAGEVTGTAPANSRVDLYYSIECDNCEPQQLFANTNADANGNWKYTGSLLNKAIVAASTKNGTTSEFTRIIVNTANIKITNACVNGFGSIKGIVPVGATTVKWYDENNNVVGNNTDLVNVPAGKYKAVVGDSWCSSSSPFFEIKNAFQLITTNVIPTHPSCENATGKISGLQLVNNSSQPLTTTWKDVNGNIKGNNLTLSNVPAGTYNLFIETADKTCVQTYGPVTLVNTTGPNINEEFVVFTAASCNQSTGSITGIQVNGTAPFKYSWKNELNQEVATTKDLLNTPAGKYRLEFSDGSSCGAITSSVFEIPETNGIGFSYQGYMVTYAKCNEANGSITGITATGATRYEWKNAAGTVVSTQSDLKNAAPGDYALTASNASCSKTSQSFRIEEIPVTVYGTYPVSIVNACGGQSNGTITVNADILAVKFKWVDDANNIRGTTSTAEGLGPGNYRLFLTDRFDCETQYGGTYTVTDAQALQLASGAEIITNDQCGLKTGSIKNITVTGGVPPYSYAWVNGQGVPVSSSPELLNVGEGIYTVKVTDASTCALSVSASYTITSQYASVQAPELQAASLCSPGDVILQVSSPAAGSVYRIYPDEITSLFIAENTDGNFKVPVTENQTFYVSRFSGTCESPRTRVKVTVGLSNMVIANTITPNGDGYNDFWVIKGIENYPQCNVQLFTRGGQKVFESNGYGVPFNGTFGGQALSAGTYYYVIRLNKVCSLISGYLNIIR